jgi:hypothetical protein
VVAAVACVALLGCSRHPDASSTVAPATTGPTETAGSAGNGTCDGVASGVCAAAVAEALAHGLVLASGASVVSWTARPTVIEQCDGAIVPEVDVAFTIKNPSAVVTVTVGVLPDGRLAACTY